MAQFEHAKSSRTYVAIYVSACQVEFYIGIIPAVKAEPKLSHTAAIILQAIGAGHAYGFSVMETTGLPSGTIYPALRRLEREGLIHSRWESQSVADSSQRPPRKYYRITPSGQATLRASQKRYPLLARLFPAGGKA
jgi:PadR family transcriptional regulator, regulatory protein PadR